VNNKNTSEHEYLTMKEFMNKYRVSRPTAMLLLERFNIPFIRTTNTSRGRPRIHARSAEERLRAGNFANN
jgi:hypothetical protein